MIEPNGTERPGLQRPGFLRPGLLLTALAGAVVILSNGCVQQDRYDELVMAKRTAEEQAVRAESERDALRQDFQTTADELSRMRGSYQSLEGQYSELDGYVRGVESEYDDYLNRIANLQIGPLPADVETQIVQLSAMYPDVLTFDAQRGLIRFSSDFTFGLGSVDLTPDARQTLRSLASILNDSNGRDFETRVVGHTDSVPIRKPETKRQHPTNVHLSVHRAISVRDALVDAGVAPARIEVAGFGEHRPLVAGSGRGGVPANRRVEIFLLGRTDGGFDMGQGQPVLGVDEPYLQPENSSAPMPQYPEPSK